MGSEDSGDRAFHQRGMNCPSDKVSGVTMCSDSMFYGCNWDPMVSLGQNGNFGNSAMVSQNEFANPHCSSILENQTMGSSSHMVQFPSDSSALVDMMPRLAGFGSGNFSEMVSSLGHNTESGYHSNLAQKKGLRIQRGLTDSQDHCQNSGDGIIRTSPYGKRKREVPQGASPKNAEEEQQKDVSGDTSEFPKEDDEKKQKPEKNMGRNKQASKQAKDSSNGAELSKDDYIHVRAKRGQATNSHSLAERVRRERISERMRLLQELVPGCNKITGKAMMLDEIINYVQSLQQQVEFLSMKLATVNPEVNVDIDRILSKDILHLRGGNATQLGIAPGLSSSHPFPGYPQGAFNGPPGTTTLFHSLPQHLWNNNELQGILQMGFDPDPSASIGPNDYIVFREACINFMELCKKKNDDKIWMDEVAAMQASYLGTSGIILAGENNDLYQTGPVKSSTSDSITRHGSLDSNASILSHQRLVCWPSACAYPWFLFGLGRS